MKLGFIGFGSMGRPMAEHLLRAGHELSVWSRRPESVAALLAQGALWRASPAEVARDAEMVCTNVTGSADVEGLAFGPEGLAEGSAPGGLHVDFSTIAPNVARDFAAGVEARLHHKDYALLMDEAARRGAALQISATVWQQLNELMGQGRRKDDTSSLLRVLETGAGQDWVR